jgi:hypothetical protein
VEGLPHDCILFYLRAVQLLVQIWGRYVMFSIWQTFSNIRIINVAVFWFKGVLCAFSPSETAALKDKTNIQPESFDLGS